MAIVWSIGLMASLFSDQEVIHPVHFAGTIFPIAGFFVNLMLSWMIIIMLRILRKSNSVNVFRWRRFYDLLCDLINTMNKGLGFLSVVNITFLCVWFVNASIYVLTNLRGEGPESTTLLFLLLEMITLVIFILIIYVPHLVKQEVKKKSKEIVHISINLERICRVLILQIDSGNIVRSKMRLVG